MYWGSKMKTDSVHPDQTPQIMLSDQFIKKSLSSFSEMGLFIFEDKYGKELRYANC